MLCAVILMGITTRVSAEAPTAVRGHLSLSSWLYNEGPPLEIKGDWEAVWGKLLSPDEFDDEYTGDYFSIPSRWNNVEAQGWNGARGVATFRINLSLPKYSGSLEYHMIAAHSAYKIFVNGELVVENGTVSDDSEKFRPNQVSRRFTALSGDSELVMQVANFSHAYGGPGHGLMLWDSRKLSRFLDVLSVVYGLVAGILFTIGLFHLILYLADRNERDGVIHLFFSMLCFIIVYRVQGIIPLLHEYFYDSNYWSSLRLPYLSLYAAPVVYLLFFRALFRQQFPKLLTLSVVLVALIMCCYTLLVSEYQFTATRNFAIWLNIFTIAYSLLFTGFAVQAKQPGASVILVSNFCFLVTAIFDAIIYTDHSTGFDLTPFGILVLGFGYSYALFLRLQSTFKGARENSKALQRLNRDLESQVKERTSAFQAAAAKAENATRDKARFIAAASHDLRQPLHALSLFNSALRRKLSKDIASPIVEKQEKAINYLGELLQDTLDTAQLDVTSKPAKFVSISTSSIKNKLLDVYAERAISSEIALNIDFEEGEIVTDPYMFQRVLNNLLDNALKASSTAVTVRGYCENNTWNFTVKDNGHGISEDQINRIFESYVSLQVDDKASDGGYGLGLYVVKEFVRTLGGTISVDSMLGNGAEFSLSLPNRLMPTSAPCEDTVLDDLTRIKGLRILAVDDDQLTLDALVVLLQEWQCEVRFARDRETAMAIAIDFNPQLVLLDYHLQDGTGLDLKSQIDQSIETSPMTIVITGATEEGIAVALNKLNIQVLQKPVSAALLGNTIIALMNNESVR